MLAPTLQALDHVVRIVPATGYTLVTATPLVSAAITDYMNTLAPGDTWVRSQLKNAFPS